MAFAEFEALHLHFNNKISTVKKTLQLRNIGQNQSLAPVLSKIAHEMPALCDQLDKMELEVQRQEKLLHSLKELQGSIEKDLIQAQHLKDNIPPHLPKKVNIGAMDLNMKPKEQAKEAMSEPVQKVTKERKVIKEMALLTVQEFESVPAYMKNRLTYDQINSAIQEINKAVKCKYKVMQQPLKSMNTNTRKLSFRFQEEETKETKGHFFIVDEDIKEFTQLKVDKRFHGILNIVRHCQRIREVRTKGLVRYMLT
ncbi:spindle and kinetochore-associated protein 1 isoform X2 [Rhinatrema bivittatum]|nr:spindle and kinetochore-associated protein 1 isoform X2 [Rhinatrema bivittatum]XP_029435956.1 spindle and kinetochore-associated protein 1 isoform X2 [Rhinatrema bivittatum]XP_029435961.1 spindle and kinetochore-associated protein 1 isoform X2 [Rhinatrema bivittatum]